MSKQPVHRRPFSGLNVATPCICFRSLHLLYRSVYMFCCCSGAFATVFCRVPRSVAAIVKLLRDPECTLYYTQSRFTTVQKYMCKGKSVYRLARVVYERASQAALSEVAKSAERNKECASNSWASKQALSTFPFTFIYRLYLSIFLLKSQSADLPIHRNVAGALDTHAMVCRCSPDFSFALALALQTPERTENFQILDISS